MKLKSKDAKKHLGHTMRFVEEVEADVILLICVTCSKSDTEVFLVDVIDDPKIKAEIRKEQRGYIAQGIVLGELGEEQQS